MESAWFIAGPEGGRDDVGYNPNVADALTCASEKLATRGGMGADLLACVAPVIRAPMSRSQKLRVLYIVSACMAAQDPPTPALEPIDEALTIALALNETRAQTELLLLRAYVHRYTSQIPDAADDLRACLELLALRPRADWAPEDELTALKAMARLATQEFACGHYAACELWLDKADELLARIGPHIDSQARIAWMRAIVARWRGVYDTALTEALAAVGFYQRLGDREMLSRIETAAAEILLDLAEQSRQRGNDAACAEWLTQAEPILEHAVHIAFSMNAMGSEALARVVRARLMLLQGIPGDRKPLLEELAHLGKQHQDMAFVCQVYTGLGRECEAEGDIAAAKEWYRRAIAAIQESKAVALTVWPQRALWRLEGEMAPALDPDAPPTEDPDASE